MNESQGHLYQPETLGDEFSVLRSILHFTSNYCVPLTRSTSSDFLETLDQGFFYNSPPNDLPSSLIVSTPTSYSSNTTQTPTTEPIFVSDTPNQGADAAVPPEEASLREAAPVVLASATKAEKFLLMAADQESGSRNERLNRVIHSKYEAGLLKPYNYVKGYARLSRWMDRKYVSPSIVLITLLTITYSKCFAGLETTNTTTLVGVAP